MLGGAVVEIGCENVGVRANVCGRLESEAYGRR